MDDDPLNKRQSAHPPLDLEQTPPEPTAIQGELNRIPFNNINPSPTKTPTKIPRALACLRDFNKSPIPTSSSSSSSFSSPSPQTDTDDSSTTEVYYGTQAGNTRFEGAKQEEMQRWKDMNVFCEVADQGQPRISTRWVCTEKVKGGQLLTKARLVARGFEEDTSQLCSDCPTCSKESLRILLAILASNHWKLNAMDIKSAFLQGFPVSRDLYLQPPKEFDKGKLWKLKKTPYGLVDAGRQWFIRIQKEFTALGAMQAKCDQAVFIWRDPGKNIIQGLLVAHVDDFLFGGDVFFLQNIIPKIRLVFTVGFEENGILKYLGLSIQQQHSSITLSTNEYSNSLKEIDTIDLGNDKKRVLTNSEITKIKSKAGQLNWITSQSRPDLAYDNCKIANSIKRPTVADIQTVNKALRKARSQEVRLSFPATFDFKSCQLVIFCDASHANLPDRGSQGAFVAFLVDNNGTYCPLAWQSKRIKRVVNSTIAAECLAAVEAAETCILLRSLFCDMSCSKEDTIPISILSDNCSLVDAVHTSTSMESKRLQIDISILREMIEKKEIQQFRWVDTRHQVANCLTKEGASPELLLSILRQSLKFDFNAGFFF